MPKVSVIIPAYNAMEYLPETLENVLQQTLRDFEVIVVDDGSSDDICSWFEAHVIDARVRLVSQENKGLSGARNTGIKHATSPYIAFPDADDLWDTSKLEKQVHLLDSDPSSGLVYTWVAYIDSQGKPTGRVRKNSAEGMIWPDLTQHNVIECGSVVLVRHECFREVGLFDESLRSIEDLDMWLRMAQHYQFRMISEPLVYYRQHTASLSKNVSVMEDCYRRVIEQAFASAPPELSHLKARSQAAAYVCLGWKPIQVQKRDYKESLRLMRKAIGYDSRVLFSKEFIWLCLAIAAIQFFGDAGYSRVLARVYELRCKLSGASSTCRL